MEPADLLGLHGEDVVHMEPVWALLVEGLYFVLGAPWDGSFPAVGSRSSHVALTGPLVDPTVLLKPVNVLPPVLLVVSGIGLRDHLGPVPLAFLATPIGRIPWGGVPIAAGLA